VPDAAESLTGAWEGLYSYPDALEPTPFKASLVEQAGALSGATQEIADVIWGPLFGDMLHATLEGWREGRRVEFLKAYHGLTWEHGYDGPILYVGELSADGVEIEGTWTNSGWSGRFLMVRAGRKAEAARRRVFAEA
jgi:hypothetical protein